MTESRQPPTDASPPGRRVLVAVVTGEVGERIQAWRERHDPAQARRIPPHATLCYWAPEYSEALDAQIQHAFPTPLTVRLGGVREFDNADHTFYVEVRDTARLDAARARLLDGTQLDLPGNSDGTWHVTCVRYGARRDIQMLRALTAEVDLGGPWRVDTIALLQLREEIYQPLHVWTLQSPPDREI